MPDSALDAVRPLLRTRQVREFEPDPVPEDILYAVTEAGRWTGSSKNSQPWRFLVVRDRDTIARLHVEGLPQTRSLATVPAFVAICMPDSPHDTIWHAYDDGRAAERMLVAAYMCGIAAGIAWVRRDVLPLARGLLGLPEDWMVRTLVVLGRPTEAAKRPKLQSGLARLPRDQVVFEDRWPSP